MSVLAARDITVSAKLGGDLVPVLRDFSLALEPGRVLGLVGESGAGKSMVGRTVAQMLPPGFAVTAGSLRFGERDLVRMPVAEKRALLGREIAFIPQEPLSALNPVLTIGQQVDEHLQRLGAGSASERRRRALELLSAVHLPRVEGLLRQYPHQISGGMCQRVLIAMAFASKPRLVVADEPTTALDVTIQARIVRLIAEMQERDGTAVLFITHDLRLAGQICDDILVLYAGRPAEYGPARAVLAAPAHPYSRCLQLANPPMSGAKRALAALPERMPGLAAYKAISGCAFAPRCPNAMAACNAAPPPFVTVSAGHTAACIRTELTAGIAAPALAGVGEPAAGAPVLDVKALSKIFTLGNMFNRKDFTAVREVSFALAANEFLAVVGESGSGKTTLARLLVGLEQPSAGSIRFADHEIVHNLTSPTHRHDAQLIFQDPQSALNPRRRVGGIVTQSLEADGTASRQERLTRARTLLAEIGLPPETVSRFPSQLSGGQRQRVNIARALCAAPKILIADEIVSGLDVSVQAQLLNLLIGLRRERAFSMVFISHDLSVVRYLCDRVLVMYRGEVVETGPTEQVFTAPSHPYTRALLSAVPPDDPAAVWAPMLAEREALGA
jgi:peptide/nickel transport system ATP-binding protein